MSVSETIDRRERKKRFSRNVHSSPPLHTHTHILGTKTKLGQTFFRGTKNDYGNALSTSVVGRRVVRYESGPIAGASRGGGGGGGGACFGQRCRRDQERRQCRATSATTTSRVRSRRPYTRARARAHTPSLTGLRPCRRKLSSPRNGTITRRASPRET